ncbi:MAG: hypothetical protein GY851_04410, partial [bacterium]|nr:hypothetical protein [bacterium]
PAVNKVVWFDHHNGYLMWDTHSVSLPSLGMPSFRCPTSGTSTWPYNYNIYIISDGVSQVNVGSNTACLTNRLFKFDWSTNTVTGHAPTAAFTPSNWWTTEQDCFNHQLFTVKGRVMYYSAANTFKLGGPVHDPSGQSTDVTLSEDVAPSQPGLDFFGRVDDDGALWFADRGCVRAAFVYHLLA